MSGDTRLGNPQRRHDHAARRAVAESPGLAETYHDSGDIVAPFYFTSCRSALERSAGQDRGDVMAPNTVEVVATGTLVQRRAP
jgi:hypothetical protein